MSRIVHGKEIYTTLEELTAPGRTAIVVVDMQNDFCHPEGSGASKGRSHDDAWAIVPRLKSLLESARAVGVPVIYALNTQRDGALYMSAAELARRAKKSGGDPLLWTIEGTWGHQVVDPIAPQEGDFTVVKHRPSAFFQTDLDLILRNLGVECLIVTGVGTSGCVESTARDAQSHDYYVIIPEDTTASQKPEWFAAAMVIMKRLYHWIGPSAEIESVWAGGGRKRASA